MQCLMWPRDDKERESLTADGHEAHFGQVATRFFDYLRDPKRLPAWERANMLAKYYTTTKGLELGYRNTTASR